MTGAREGQRGGSWTVRSRVIAGDIGIMGRRKVTPMWEDDSVQRQASGGGVRAGGGCPPGRKL